MTKRKKILANEQGFTLIEIIAVLVLLGILAAVAVPKYISLQSEAELKTIQSVKAELQSRASMYHGRWLLSGSGSISQTLAQWATESVGADFSLSVSGSDLMVTAVSSGNTYDVVFTIGNSTSTPKAAVFGAVTAN